MSVIKIPTFNLEDLHGKILKIYTSESEDGKVVVGIDEETDVMYVLHQDINVEVPLVINTELPNLNGRGTSSIFPSNKPPKPPRQFRSIKHRKG